MTGIVAMVPGRLPMEAVIGGLAFQVELIEGPLAHVRFGITVPSLVDLPDAFIVEGGAYVRWITVDGEQMHTVDGGPCYQWRPS